MLGRRGGRRGRGRPRREECVYPAESVRGDAVVVPQVELLEEKFELPRREAEAGVRGEHGRELGPVATEGKQREGRSWSGQRVRRKEVGSVSVVRWRPRAHAPAHGSVRALEDVLRDIFETEREFDLGRRGDCHGRLEGARDTARRAGEPRRPHRRVWFNSRDSSHFGPIDYIANLE